MANFTDYCISAFVIIFGILAVSLVTFYSINPGVKEQSLKCSEILEATHLTTKYPYLGQGILLTTGVIFFIVAILTGELSMPPMTRQESAESSRRMKKAFAASVFIGIFLSLCIGALYIGSRTFVSPSFMATCKPFKLKHIQFFCSAMSSPEEIFVKVAQLNCTAAEHVLAFTGSCNPIMMTIQTFLMSILILWTIERFSVLSISRVIVNSVMATFFILGIGCTAMNANEAYLNTFIHQSLIGIKVAAATSFIFGGLLAATHESHQPLPSRDLPDQRLPAAPRVSSMPALVSPPTVVTQSAPDIIYSPLESVYH